MPALTMYDGTTVTVTSGKSATPGGVRESKVSAADVSTAPDGRFAFAFATLNVVDSQGDVTVPGAFQPTDVVLSQFNHATWQPGYLPVGRGRIREEGNLAVFRGQFFMKMLAARETFEALAGMKELAEFSYGFNVLESERGSFNGELVRFIQKLAVYEVSPVLKGAGVGTRVLELSSASATQLELANIARENERRLADLRGYGRPIRRIVGWAPDGRPVYSWDAA